MLATVQRLGLRPRLADRRRCRMVPSPAPLCAVIAAFCLAASAAAYSSPWPQNDTGLDWWASGDSIYLSNEPSDFPGQDASYGRDASQNNDADGEAGFAFTKLDSAGEALSASATTWDCVRDEVTGLVWEVKTESGLHGRDDRYTWLESDASRNGGYPGDANDLGASCFGYDAGAPDTFCNTQAYVDRVNAAGRCGASDWRFPTWAELLSIAHYGRIGPAIDPQYFPNTASSSYWSSTPSAQSPGDAWYLNFGNGNDGAGDKGSEYALRLVRGGQALPDRFELSVTLTGGDQGGILSDPPGIDCGTDCSSGFASGETVVLTASPAAGYAVHWGGACSGTAATCELTLSAPAEVTAGFFEIGAPVITPPPDVATEATAALTPIDIGLATAHDGSVVTSDAPADGLFPLGPTTVTWSATNAAGTSTATQLVTVTDSTGPVLTVPADIVTEADPGGGPTQIDIGEASATDIFGPVLVSNDGPSDGLFPLGTTTVTWTATDDNGNSTSDTQSIIVTSGGNQLPVAADDSASLQPQGSVSIDVLANDSDDGSLDPASIRIQTPPSHGSLVDNLDGTLTYTHEDAAATSDGFTYTVADNVGAESNVASVAISILGEEWRRNTHSHRVALELTAGAAPLFDRFATLPIDFTDLFAQAGVSPATLDPDSLRVLEIGATGEVLDPAVPFQFDPAVDFDASGNAHGELVLALQGETPASSARTYHLYFAQPGAEFPPPPVLPRLIVTESVPDEGQSSIAVRTPTGDWYYHEVGAGFSSLDDLDGKDWIGYSTATGASGEYRGIPNLLPPASGGHFHPGKTSAVSALVEQGPLRARIHSTTLDSSWATQWDILPSQAILTVLAAPEDYWFLYEGTPGGTLDLVDDQVVRSDGTQDTAATTWVEDLAGPEWVAFADPAVGRSLFVANHQDDAAIDSYRPMDGAMTVFGFGRQNLDAQLTGTPRRFSVGLIDATSFDDLAPLVRSAAAEDLSLTLGPVQANPGGAGDLVARALADQVAGPSPFTLSVDAAGSSGSITTHEWDFGDGGTANGPTATHIYAADGVFEVVLRVTDHQGATDTDRLSVVVGDERPGSWPTAVAQASVMGGDAPLTVIFSGAGSSDPDEDIVGLSWDFGDGGVANGASVSHTFATEGTYEVVLTVTDSEGRRGRDTLSVSVTSSDTGPPGDAGVHFDTLDGVGADWQSITLPQSYISPVVIAAVQYDSPPAQPAIVRVRNAAANRFEIRLQNPSGAPLASAYTVHYLVVEAGVYTLGEHGIKMEAHRLTSTQTNSKGSWWHGDSLSYSQSYTNPVVLGQVMSAEDADWSAFWARGSDRDRPPSASDLVISKHVGEDEDTTRANETLGVVIIEAGSGKLNGIAYAAGLSPEQVADPESAPHLIDHPWPANGAPARVALLAAAAMQGPDGGWPVLFGPAPVSDASLELAFQEDQIGDAETAHTPEHVAYLVLGGSSEPQPPLITPPPDLTAEATALLTPLDIGTATTNDDSPVTSDAPIDGFPLGTTTVTWTAANDIGTSTATQQISVVDTTAPLLTLPPDILADATGTLTDVDIGSASATDLFEPVTITNDAPTAGFPVGTTIVTWSATDANANTSSDTQSVILTSSGNQLPLAEDDLASLAQGESLAIAVLDNDSDADGTLVPATLSVQSGPEHGSLSHDGSGVLTYTHDGSDATSDTFTYTVEDDLGAVSNSATVTLSITLEEPALWPIAYWPLDESAGTLASDASGNGNDLTLAGNPPDDPQWRPAEGLINGALSLSGSGYASIAAADLEATMPGNSVGATEDFTISAWVYLNDGALGDRNPILTKQGEPERGFMLSAGTSGGTKGLYFEVFEDSGQATDKTSAVSSQTLVVETWQHVAVIYDYNPGDDSALLTLCVDGNCDRAVAAVGPLRVNAEPLELGRYTWNNQYARYFDGLLDEVQLFNVALTQAEISEIIEGAELR